ncbi:hypothetical protein JMJ77_0008180 [Colletotrichum scovillei]|uniref:Uncharacterized protein n=1 Tax=Colletotrichum scovillei TaxID=1209932 RepID=A0A9P7REA4_9PEZI|nr:hypothetical protein JMJ77_0008180 [Colletotrichum scovillei]KAG7075172.1 hypothetical protein JMJ76_0011634 [Colletotrichum scovillei]KAG7082144.1 hypothetical protein JMJ78_0004249 [Colletotrichum scovillei]
MRSMTCGSSSPPTPDEAPSSPAQYETFLEETACMRTRGTHVERGRRRATRPRANILEAQPSDGELHVNSVKSECN